MSSFYLFISQSVRPLAGPSVRPLAGPSVRPLVVFNFTQVSLIIMIRVHSSI